MRYHKRLMLLTIACLLPSALARLPVDFIDNRLILWLVDAVVLVCVWDSIAGGNADCIQPSVGELRWCWECCTPPFMSLRRRVGSHWALGWCRNPIG